MQVAAVCKIVAAILAGVKAAGDFGAHADVLYAALNQTPPTHR